MSNFIDDLLSVVSPLAEGYANYTEQEVKRLKNKRTYLANQIDNINNTDEGASLSSTITQFNKDVSSLGYDELSLKNVFNEKIDSYALADSSYNAAKAYQDKYEINPDGYAQDIVDMPWSDVFKEMSKINYLQENIANAKNNKHSYNTSKKTDANGDVIRYYSSTSLNNALKVRKEALTKQVFLLDKNPDIVNIIKDDGTMDEELVDYFNGIKSGMLTSDSNTFKQSYNGILNHTAKQFDYNEKMYIKYEKLLQKQTGSLTVGELKKDNDNDDLDTILWGAVGEDMGDNDVLPKDYLRQMTKLYSDRGKEYNEIYETYGKAKYRQQTAWNPEGLSPEKIEGTEEFQEIQDNKAYKKGAVTDAEEEFDDRAYEEGAVSEADPSLIGGQNLQKTTYTPDDTEEGDEGGIDFGKITAGVVLTGAAASTEPVQKVGKAIVKATKDGAKYLSTAYNISAKDIPVLTKEINNKKGSIRVALDKIKNLEEKIKTIDSKNRVKNKGFSFIDKSIDTAKDDPYRTKRLNITNKINAIKKDMVEKTAKRFKIKPEDVARMLSNKEMSKWNPVKVKDYFMNKFPKATKEFYKTSKIVKGAKGLAQYRAGAELADLSGIDLGEGFIAETAEDVTATAAATKALNEAGKRFIPKLKSIATSPKGRQAIIKLLGERVGKNLIKQAAGSAVPGIGNIAMTLTGAVLGIKDFIQFVFSYNEE